VNHVAERSGKTQTSMTLSFTSLLAGEVATRMRRGWGVWSGAKSHPLRIAQRAAASPVKGEAKDGGDDFFLSPPPSKRGRQDSDDRYFFSFTSPLAGEVATRMRRGWGVKQTKSHPHRERATRCRLPLRGGGENQAIKCRQSKSI